MTWDSNHLADADKFDHIRRVNVMGAFQMSYGANQAEHPERSSGVCYVVEGCGAAIVGAASFDCARQTTPGSAQDAHSTLQGDVATNPFGMHPNVMLGLYVPALVTPLELLGGQDENEG